MFFPDISQLLTCTVRDSIFLLLSEVISLVSVSERSSLPIFLVELAVLLGAEDDKITTVILSVTEVNETRLRQPAE